ncbi:MAG TPA: tetratricopeptide repeat protein [Kiloniellales bacterium]|nr:tetratricopeptide repeat protein [Kiloniellales bacterium]
MKALWMRDLALAAIVAAALPMTDALAADTGGKKCPQGQTWSDSAGKCVPAAADELIDQEVTDRGRALAKAGNYEEAIALLSTVKEPTSVTLTYLGYSYRKLGQVDLGLSYYHQALSLDPEDLDTREYLGEGYVATGQIDLAREQLAAIEQRCGTDCEQYEELHEAIEAAM